MRNKLLSTILMMACLTSMVSCVDKNYDLENIDKTYHVDKASRSYAEPFYNYAQVLTYNRQDVIWQDGVFTLNLPAIQGGYMLGTMLFDIGYSFAAEYYTTEFELSATITTDFPYEMKADILPVEERMTEEGYYDYFPTDKITVTPSSCPISKSKVTKINLKFTSESEVNFLGIYLALTTTVPTVQLNDQNYIALSDVKIRFPKGATVKKQ